MISKDNPLEHFDSPTSDNGEITDIKGMKERIQFFEEKKVTFKLPNESESKCPNKIELIKQKLLKRVYGEEDDAVLSGDCSELSDSEDANHSKNTVSSIPKESLSVLTSNENFNEKTSLNQINLETGKKVSKVAHKVKEDDSNEIHESNSCLKRKLKKENSCVSMESNLNVSEKTGIPLSNEESFKNAFKAAKEQFRNLEMESSKATNKSNEKSTKAIKNNNQECKQNKCDANNNSPSGTVNEKKSTVSSCTCSHVIHSENDIANSVFLSPFSETSFHQPKVSFVDSSIKSNKSNINEIVEQHLSDSQNSDFEEPDSTCLSFQSENLDEELRNITIREMIKNVEKEISKEKDSISNNFDSPKLSYTEIEPTSLELKQSSLPTTRELLEDFSLFSSRPTFLNIPQILKPTLYSISTKNLYNGQNLLFSKSDLLSKEFTFRAPGSPLSSRPILTPISSILTETSILHYIKVSVQSADTNWMILKELNDSDKLIPNNSDEELNRFILTDVVTEVFRRSNFLIYDHRVVIGKFIGKTLCLCSGMACLKSLACMKIEKIGRAKMLIDGIELEVSCETERNEWFETIKKLSCS